VRQAPGFAGSLIFKVNHGRALMPGSQDTFWLCWKDVLFPVTTSTSIDANSAFPPMLDRLHSFIDTLSKYFLVRIELTKLGARQQIERQIVRLIYLIILFIIGLSSFNLILMLSALLINKYLQSTYLEFLFVAVLLFTSLLALLVSGSYVKSQIHKLLLFIFKSRN
jgi:hypothetical protein